jgi:Cu2+-exporting ATPase
LISEGVAQDVQLSSVRIGDRLRVLPGETIPVDGILETASARIGEAHLTGEAQAAQKRVGDPVFAGSTVESAPLELTATAVGETTRLARLAHMMQEASGRRAPIVATHDRVAGYFVGSVLLLAAITAGIWSVLDPGRALWNAAALLVITCPCALGLGTPVALAIAMGRAARRGLFVKGQDGIERLASVTHVILDKTGTLTEGKLSVVRTSFAAQFNETEREELARAVSALEKSSGHAIATAFDSRPHSDVEITEFESVAGQGIRGIVNDIEYRIGTAEFAAESSELNAELIRFAEDAAAEGLTSIFVSRNREVIAAYVLGDALRGETVDAISALKSQQLELEILSGDDAKVVQSLGAKLGITDGRGRATPEDKLSRVEALESAGVHTAMVGDGVNDAAALSAATAGISVAGATEIARDAADVFVSQRGPAAIAELFKLSRRAMKVVRVNIAIALFYNLIGASLAMAGLVSPLVAAVLMPLSSLTVLTLAVKG